LSIGSHLKAQFWADRLQLSRSPINRAFSLLEEKGVVRREQFRGYFLAKEIPDLLENFLSELGLSKQDTISTVYYQMMTGSKDCWTMNFPKNRSRNAIT